MDVSADLDDLLRFAQRIWSLHSRFHIGDLAWQLGRAPTGVPPTALWRSDGSAEVAAWGMLDGGSLSLLVDPARPDLIGEVLAWARSVHGGSPDVVVLDRETHLVDHLIAAGYAADLGGPFFLAHHLRLASL